MHFTISSATLQKELGYLQGTVERKTSIPVLANLLIESLDQDRVRLIGTDLDVTLRCEVEVEEVVEEGNICVPARKLFEIARLLPNALVRLKKESNDWVSVKCDRSRFKLPGVLKDQFPETPAPKAGTIKVPAPMLRLFIERTQFAITQEESRYTLSGAKFVIKNGRMQMITTDGHRLALMESNGIDPKAEVDTMIPRKTLSELTRVMSGFEGEIALTKDDNHIYFEVGPRLLISRMLFGQFPSWEMVLPKGCDKTILAETTPLNQALRRAALMADSRSHAVKLSIATNQIGFSGETADEGEAAEAVAVDYQGENVEIGFNASYLEDFFGATLGKKIKIELKDGSSQALLSVPEEASCSYTYVVMPMRI